MSSLKKILKNIITDLSLNIYKKVSPDGFPSGWDLASDIQRLTPQANIKTIFDVGANVGKMSLYFNKQFPHSKIVSFEPIKNTFQLLENNTKNYQNISCFNHALGNSNTSKQIQLNNNSEQNSLLDLINTNNQNISQNLEVINIKTIDSFCSEENINKIDILKTDTEGFDFEVLQGAEKFLNDTNISFIISEVGFNLSDKRHTFFPLIYDYLYQKGFRFYAFYDLAYWLPHRYHGLIYCNALFVNFNLLKS